MSWTRLLAFSLLTGLLAVSACGKKGPPERPVEKTEEAGTS